MDEVQEFTLPVGTVCKRNGIPFELKADTVILCHIANWPLIKDEFHPGVNIQRLDCNQDAHSVENPCHAASLPVMSTTNSSSFESSCVPSQFRTCVGVNAVSTIQVESKQCQ